MTVNLIAFNDFHGAIDPPTGSGGLVNGTPAGGVEYLATAVKELRAEQEQESPYSFTVAAGTSSARARWSVRRSTTSRRSTR